MCSIRRVFITIPALFACAMALAPVGASSALACTAQDFGAVVDQTAQALRDLNVNGANRFQAKLQQLREKHGLSEDEIQTRAATLQDEKMGEFNREIETLVNQMDTLSQTPNEKINCEKLDEFKRVRDRLLTVMGQKSGYMLAKADVELDRPAGTPPANPAPAHAETAPAVAPSAHKSDRLDIKRAETANNAPPIQRNDANPPAEPPAPAEPPTPAEAPAPKPQATAEAPAPAPAPIPAMPERRTEPAPVQTARDWTTESQTFAPTPPGLLRPDLRRDDPDAGQPAALAPPADGQLQLPPPGEGGNGTYSIAEIQEAGRGIFGTITAQFAGAINYAFQNFGQPNAYITGNEGGAAFLAGLRYGKGRLHIKSAPDTDIYWQGPSVGYDLGAEGSNALFLVYNVDEPNRIYGRFSGVGGAAYVAGGIGVNVLGKGGMVMVPIRSGVGLRIGANLAYLKFTERQTWNPF